MLLERAPRKVPVLELELVQLLELLLVPRQVPERVLGRTPRREPGLTPGQDRD